MGQFLDSVRSVKQNYKRYDDWEQRQADERARKEYLSEIVNIPQDKVELVSKKSQTVIRATEIMDRYSEDNCEDMELATGLVSVVPIVATQLIGEMVTSGVISSTSNKIEKNINKLKSELKTPLGKDVYNADDIRDEIKMLNKRLNNVNTKYKFYGLGINTLVGLVLASALILWGNSKQKDASRIGRFQAKQKDLKDIKNFVIYTPEQEKQAEETAKKLADKKEQKGIIKTFSNLINVYKDSKAYKEWLQTRDNNVIEKLKSGKYTAEQLAAAKDDKELIVDTVKEINIKAEEYSENVENAFDTLSTISWVISAPIGFLINSLLKVCKVSKPYRLAVSAGIPLLTSLTLSISGTFAQKKAARVGRYVARKDLSSNPKRLLSYSDEDMKKAQNITAPEQKKTIGEKIGQSFIFLKNYIKDSSEYEKYKKTVHNQQEKMQKAYQNIQITDEQKLNAEKLQKKVFLAFDEIDEMSQRYSEDIEASTDIAKNIFGQLIGLGYSGVLALSALAIAKGTFPFTKIANSLINLGFKKDSPLRIAANNFYNTLKSDKKQMKRFQLAILDNELITYLKRCKSREVVSTLNKLKREYNNIFKNEDISNFENLKKALTNNHLKQGILAKWVRGLITEGTYLFVNNKLDMPSGSWKNYKTLIGTASIAGIPILGGIFALPYMFNAWLTNIQKKAGKIGIMTAMEKIDDERIFAE